MHRSRILATFPPFSSLPDHTCAALAEISVMRRYNKGEVLFLEGDQDPYLLLVVEGTIKACKQNLGGKPVFLRSLGKGELIGVTSMLEQQPRSATMIAETSVTVLAIPQESIRSLLDEASAAGRIFQKELLIALAGKVRSKNRLVAQLGTPESNAQVVATVFDSKPYMEAPLKKASGDKVQFRWFEARLSAETVRLAEGSSAVCAFVNDQLSREVVFAIRDMGINHIALRCAGFNNVDLAACKEAGVIVTRVPAYSPHAVAEHAVALLLGLNRKVHRAYNRVRDGNFRLDNLVGFDLHGKTIGVIGTGKIGQVMAAIMKGFGSTVVAYDPFPDETFATASHVSYVPLQQLIRDSDVISLHAPLTKDTHHLINEKAVSEMKNGVILINTSRGGLVDTKALIEGLKSGKVGGAGLDVYEEEAEYFFEDFSYRGVSDDVLARLLTFNNVLVTSHQAFLTNEALDAIATTVVGNLIEVASGKREVTPKNAVGHQ